MGAAEPPLLPLSPDANSVGNVAAVGAEVSVAVVVVVAARVVVVGTGLLVTSMIGRSLLVKGSVSDTPSAPRNGMLIPDGTT